VKPLPAPSVRGKTPWVRLDSAVRKVFTISKEQLNEELAQEKNRRKRPAARKRIHRK